MKKSLLVLALFGFVASNSYAADITGAVGLDVGSLNIKKTKNFFPKGTTSTGKAHFKKVSCFTYGVTASVRYLFNPNFYFGAHVGFDFMNKKAKPNLDEAGIVAALGGVPNSTDLEVLGLHNNNKKLLGIISDTKDYVHVKYKSMMNLGLDFGYRFNSTMFAELSLSYVHNNAKCKIVKLDKADAKLEALAKEGVYAANTILGEFNKLREDIKKNIKLKKNGLGIGLKVGANITPSCQVTLGGTYITSIKAWNIKAGVAYVF